MRRRLAVLLGFVVGLGSAASASAQWREMRNARLNESAFYDGDSFELVTGKSRRVYRLYFVDAPETDLSFPDRVRDQAAYFGVSMERALELGEEAKRFVRDFMKDGVTVYHKRQIAGGRGRRYFAMVRAPDGRWLCEALVEAGLARIFGVGEDLPDGTRAADHWRRLRDAERRARELRAGGWAGRPGRRVRERSLVVP